jgi:ferredoxin-NADP reductase
MDAKKIKTIKAKLSELIEETADTRTIRFKFPNGHSLDFLPGQFSMVKTNVEVNGKMESVARPLSLATSPTVKDHIDFTVKEVPGGLFSTHIVRKAKVGDEFEIKGPFGLFTFKEGSTDNIVLVGGGCGIVPLMCMIRYVIDKKLSVKITLLYSNKTPDDIIYYKELEELRKKYKNLNVIHTITRPEGFEWKGRTGRIDEALLKKYLGNEKTIFYICGPPPLMEAMDFMMDELKIDPEKIKMEKYHS